MSRTIRLLVLVCFPFCLNAANPDDFVKYLQNDAAFTPNQGQLRDMNGEPVNNVMAYYTVPGLNIYITTKGVTYVMQQFENDASAKPHPVFVNEKHSIIKYSRVDVDLQGAQISAANFEFSDAVSWNSNYYKSSDGEGQLGVAHYKTLTVKNVYPGIDWVWKSEGSNKLEYDFVVHPGASPNSIRMNYSYADITPSANKLLIASKYGALAEGPLQANSSGKDVNIKYLFNKKSNAVTFNTGAYDHSSDLVIDPPLVLQWSAYFGGSFNNGLRGVATDTASPYIYLVGYTNSPDFPTYNPGGSAYFDGSYNGSSDAVLLKIDTAQNLKWSTFFGGAGNDYANSVTIDAAGTIYVAGAAQSGFPLRIYAGGYNQLAVTSQDAFIAAFNSNLSLKWSTFYGGNGTSEALKIRADRQNGCLYMVGYSNSTGNTFPTDSSGGSYFQGNAVGEDAFIAMFNSNYALIRSTLYGGSGDDYATGVATDSLSHVVVCGFTTSTDFPVSNIGGGYYKPNNSGATDGFILRFTQLLVQDEATYIGGSGNDYLSDVASGQSGSMDFSGWTYSTNFPHVVNGLAYNQPSLAGASDAVVMQFDNTMNMAWSTYYGGSDSDVATALTCDKNGRIYLTGFTFSTNFPLDSPHYAGGYYQSTNHGLSDGFIAGFSSLGLRFWSTYKGDSCYEYPSDIAYNDKFNKFYIVGEDLLDCQGLPDTGEVNGRGASTIGFCWGFDNTGVAGSGGGNGGPPGCFGASISGIKIPCPASQCNGTAIAHFSGGTPPYSISWSDGESTDTATHLCQGNNFLEVQDAAGCAAQEPFTTQGLTASISASVVTCSGPGAVGVIASGGVTPYYYAWSNGDHGNYITTEYSGHAAYFTVTITDAAGCTVSLGDSIYDNTTTSPDSIAIIKLPACGQSNGILAAYINKIPATVTWDIGFYDSFNINNASSYYQLVADTIYNVGFDTLYAIDNTLGCWHGKFQDVSDYFMDSIAFGYPNDTQTYINPPLACNDSLGSIQLYFYFTNDNSSQFTYSWSDSVSQTTYSYGFYERDNVPPGVYTLTITDQYGCTISMPADTLVLTDTGFSLTTGSMPQMCQPNNGVAWVNTVNGFTPFYYYWYQGGYTDTVYNQYPGFYNVQVTDSFGCTLFDTVTVGGYPITTDGLMAQNCGSNGSGNLGMASVQPQGNSPFYVQWSTGDTGLQVSNLVFGNYYVTVTDSLGCILTDSFNITTLNWGFGWNPLFYWIGCNYTDSDYLYLTLPTASQFQIQFGSTQVILDSPYYEVAMLPGTYFGVQAQNISMDGQVCAIDTFLTAALPRGFTDTIIPSLSGGGCADSSNSLTAIITDDYSVDFWNYTPTYTYQWSNGANTATISNLPPGLYTVTIASSTNVAQVICEKVSSYTIVATDSVSITGDSVSNVTCYGLNNGSISIMPANPGNIQSYNWSDGNSSTASDISLAPGNYQCTITDNNGCSTSQSFSITQPDSLSVFANIQNSVCTTGGSIQLTVSGGTPGYSYSWSNNEFGARDSLLAPGSYACTVSDTNSCSAQLNYTVASSIDSVKANLRTQNCDWNNAFINSGVAAVSPSSGYPPYFVQWSTGDTGLQVNNLVTGNYTVTVTDANGCSLTDSFSINQFNWQQLNFFIFPPCTYADSATLYASAPNADISIIFSGNSYQYNDYAQFNFVPGQYFEIQATTVYYVGGYPDYFCYLDSELTAPLPAGFTDSIYTIGTNDICKGASQSLAVVITNNYDGYSPIAYHWNNGATTDTVTNLSPGIYTVTVSNTYTLCNLVNTDTVVSSNLIIAQNNVQGVTCISAANGSINLQVIGGTGNYTYGWSNFEQTASDTALNPGIYYCTVTDGNGCTVQVSDTITQPSLIIVYVSSQNLKCYNANNGYISANATGGAGAYRYQWSNNEFAASDTLLSTATYTGTVTDANGCSVSINPVTITAPPQIWVTDSANNPTCPDSSNGNITLVVSGGAGGYSYQWNNHATDSIITNLAGGTYTCTVTDANGCTVSQQLHIMQPSAFSITVNSGNTTCFDSANGSIGLSVTGGTGSYTYRWSDNANGSTNTLLPAGNYACTITDANGCVITDSFAITSPDSLNALFTVLEPTCGESTGSIILDSASGGTQPYTLHWSNGASGTSVNNIASGVYTVTITDNNGCVYSFSDSLPCITGIENIAADNVLSIYPNPASTVLYISSAQKQDYALQLRDITGRMVQQLYFTQSTILDVAEFARGVYLAEIYDRHGVLVMTGKVVLQ